MNEWKIPYPKGLFISNSTPAPDGYCSLLDNFIPTTKGLQIRKGNKIIDYDYEYTFLAPLTALNALVCFHKEGIRLYYLETGVFEDIIHNAVETPINYMETNNRLILFYDNFSPFELFEQSGTWKYEVLSFTPNSGSTIDFTNFTHAIRYKERLFYFKKGSNKVYYTIALGYKGELRSFDFTGVFNTKGNLCFCTVLGYTAGVGVQSHFVVVFESGDILIYNGNNPENPETWVALSKISLNTKVYPHYITLGTNVYCLTQSGIADLNSTITTNSTINTFYLDDAIKDAQVDYSKMRLLTFDTFMLLFVSNNAYDFLYNIATSGWTRLSGITIGNAVAFNKRMFFISSNIFYEAFSTVADEYLTLLFNGLKVISKKEIKATYQTTWSDLGTSYNKKINFITLDLLQVGGDYTVFASVGSNYRSEYLNKAKLPKQISTVLRWNAIDSQPWGIITQKLWLPPRQNAYQSIKFPRGSFGRVNAVKIDVTGLDVNSFVIGNLSLNGIVSGS